MAAGRPGRSRGAVGAAGPGANPSNAAGLGANPSNAAASASRDDCQKYRDMVLSEIMYSGPKVGDQMGRGPFGERLSPRVLVRV